MCQSQLINHQTRNLLSTTTDDSDEVSYAFHYTPEQVQNAIDNMQNVFTMVGLTEDMITTARMVGQVFPWLAEDLLATLSDMSQSSSSSSSSNSSNKDDDDKGEPANFWDPVFRIMGEPDEKNAPKVRVQVPPDTVLRTCPIRHENASPSNNHCANNGRDHLPLPNVPPDDATIAAILAHNAADLELYEAAVQQFALQRQVLFGE